jgi:hypothetical protein
VAGYSGTPLVQKLGIKAGHHLALIHAPADFADTLGEMPPGILARVNLRNRDRFDVILFFVESAARLGEHFPILAGRLNPSGGLWVAWPKRASGVATDLTEDVVRAVGLAAGLVDNKVCAIDETWSGLRFVIRLQDR